MTITGVIVATVDTGGVSDSDNPSMKRLKVPVVPTMLMFVLAGLGGFYLPSPATSAFSSTNQPVEANQGANH